jgi:hypothetical protein
MVEVEDAFLSRWGNPVDLLFWSKRANLLAESATPLFILYILYLYP